MFGDGRVRGMRLKIGRLGQSEVSIVIRIIRMRAGRQYGRHRTQGGGVISCLRDAPVCISRAEHQSGVEVVSATGRYLIECVCRRTARYRYRIGILSG